jgi:hypothetical protein
MFTSALLTHFDIVAVGFFIALGILSFFQCGSKGDFNNSTVD